MVTIYPSDAKCKSMLVVGRIKYTVYFFENDNHRRINNVLNIFVFIFLKTIIIKESITS